MASVYRLRSAHEATRHKKGAGRGVLEYWLQKVGRNIQRKSASINPGANKDYKHKIAPCHPLKALTSVLNTTLALSLTRILAFQNPGSALGSQGRAAWSGLGDCRGALRPRHPPPATGVGFIAISFRSQLSFGRYFSTAHIQLDIKSPLAV